LRFHRKKPGYPLVSFARRAGQKDTASIPCANQNRFAVLILRSFASQNSWNVFSKTAPGTEFRQSGRVLRRFLLLIRAKFGGQQKFNRKNAFKPSRPVFPGQYQHKGVTHVLQPKNQAAGNRSVPQLTPLCFTKAYAGLRGTQHGTPE
jgi:hypothetical protein